MRRLVVRAGQQSQSINVACRLTSFLRRQNLKQLPPILGRNRKIAAEVEDDDRFASSPHHPPNHLLCDDSLAETHLVGDEEPPVPPSRTKSA